MNTSHESALREAGLRVTGPRLATLDVVASRPHQTADAIAFAVRERLGSVSKQTIYDVLNALTEAQILRRISVNSRGGQFELEAHDNHHHLVCTRCGGVEDVPCPVGTVPCMVPVEDHGFLVEQADVIFRGICVQCQSSNHQHTRQTTF